MEDDALRIFISYTHDSDQHRQQVLELSDRLRDDGLDCEIDRYVHQSPPEGWPKWMMRQVTTARYVIVVCTERYHRRVTTDDEPGTGLGGKWEGALITQELYESGGANTKFIPVAFVAVDLQYRPPFLRGTTFYDLSSQDGYERLYRHITDQPAVMKPPVGRIRRMPEPALTPSLSPTTISTDESREDPKRLASLVLLFPLDIGMKALTFEAARVEVGEKVTVEVLAHDSAATMWFANLADHSSAKIGLSFRNSPLLVRLLSAKQIVDDGEEHWLLLFSPSREHLETGVMGEMSFSSYSADDIATMRARRILLDEPMNQQAGTALGHLNEDMLEVLVRGLNSVVESQKSPFPNLYNAVGSEPGYFVTVARLFAQLLLYLSATVERVIKLQLTLQAGDKLSVEFEGQRPRRYTNVDPPIIRVVGVCDLRSEPET
jgi:hypothetical protein